MTLLSRKADYALLLLSHLYQHPEGGNARAIAEKFGLSRAFVANIFKELCQKGFVTSHRGVKGGYALARPAESISLAELLENLEDGFRLTACTSDANGHDDGCSLSSVCTVKGPMVEVHRRLMEVLRGVSLAEICAPHLARPVAHTALPLIEMAGGCCSRMNAVNASTA